MPGVRLKGCLRGNGDGQPIRKDGPRTNTLDFCDCKVCEASRWMQGKILRGQLAPAQESAVRELIRALGGEA